MTGIENRSETEKLELGPKDSRIKKYFAGCFFFFLIKSLGVSQRQSRDFFWREKQIRNKRRLDEKRSQVNSAQNRPR